MIESDRNCNFCQLIKARHLIKLKVIQSNYDLKEIAKEIGTTDRRIRRTHTNLLGYNLYKYVTDNRIELAKCLLLNTNHQVKRIGGLCGYSTASRFTTNFKKSTGLTPNEFRNLNSF